MREKIKDKEYWLCFVAVTGYYILGMSNILSANNTTYALEQIHSYDSSLFANNFSVYTDGMSVRFFMNFIVGLGMKFSHGSWTAIAIPLIYLGVLILALATVEIVFNITDKYRIFIVLILAYLLRNSINTGFPGWGSFEVASLGMGTAYTFTMLAFSQVVGKKKKWNVAWIILSIAALCHVHEGLWGFCLLFVIYLCQVINEKKLGLGKEHATFLVFVVVMGICVFPGIFGKGAGISNEEFVQIYAYYRAPHHLVPSEWGIITILKNLFLIVAGVMLRGMTLFFTNKEGGKSFKWEAAIAIISWIGAVCVIYLFTEVVPVASIVTMYISKYFKYIGILSQVWCIKNVREWLEKKEYLIAGILVSVVIVGSGLRLGSVALYGTLLIAIVLWKRYEVNEMQWILPISIFSIVAGQKAEMLIICIMFLVLIYAVVFWDRSPLVKKMVNNVVFIIVVSVMILGVSTRNKVWSWDNGCITRVTANSYMVRGVGDELYYLAQDFKNSTSVDTMFISAPDDGMTSDFQLASERNCFVNSRNVPAAQSQMKEWYDKVIETTGLFDKDITDIYSIMDKENIEYILVKNGYYEKFDSSGLYDVRNISYGNQYRIYKTKQGVR